MHARPHPRQRLRRANLRTRAGFATAELQARFVARDLNDGGKQQLGMHSFEDAPVTVGVDV